MKNKDEIDRMIEEGLLKVGTFKDRGSKGGEVWFPDEKEPLKIDDFRK